MSLYFKVRKTLSKLFGTLSHSDLKQSHNSHKEHLSKDKRAAISPPLTRGIAALKPWKLWSGKTSVDMHKQNAKTNKS